MVALNDILHLRKVRVTEKGGSVWWKQRGRNVKTIWFTLLLKE